MDSRTYSLDVDGSFDVRINQFYYTNYEYVYRTRWSLGVSGPRFDWARAMYSAMVF